jgi:hypothetical protein
MGALGMIKRLGDSMPDISLLSLTDTLPLSCMRSGTCSHGKSVWLMGLALHLDRSVAAGPADLIGHWIATAKGFGALE